jgi:hypothetical protein
MSSITLEEIRKIVRDVVSELMPTEPASSQARSASSKDQGLRVLIVFHAGVRKLDEALKQVRLIEEIAGKSGVFTGESAREWVCGNDVKEKTGVRCILDTIKPDGLEKVLERADMLILPTLCIKVAAKVAHLTCDDQESNIVLSALLQGKKVLASRDGFLLCDVLVNLKLRDEIEWILNKLESFGVVFCPTNRLKATFQELAVSTQSPKTSTSTEAIVDDATPALNLITAKSINTAVDNNQNSIMLASGGKVTPLARDLAKEYDIKIIEI